MCGGASGLEKRQCIAQLTIFADGEPRVKPLLTFRETGKQITLAEKVHYNRRESVIFNQRPGVTKGSCATGCEHVGSQLAKVPCISS